MIQVICACCKAAVSVQGPPGVPGARQAYCQGFGSFVFNSSDTCAEEKHGLISPVHPTTEMRAAQPSSALGIMGQIRLKTL